MCILSRHGAPLFITLVQHAERQPPVHGEIPNGSDSESQGHPKRDPKMKAGYSHPQRDFVDAEAHTRNPHKDKQLA